MREGEKSRVQERDVGDEGFYLCGGCGGTVRGRESDGAPYPIRKAAVSGCSDSVFYITTRNREKKADANYLLDSMKTTTTKKDAMAPTESSQRRYTHRSTGLGPGGPHKASCAEQSRDAEPDVPSPTFGLLRSPRKATLIPKG
jgi:hypothetical protein